MTHNNHQEKNRTSIRILQGIVIIGFLVLLVRIVQLQIIDHQSYTLDSMKNSLRMEVVNPARGIIKDRNGTIIVDNQPIYSITITPASFNMENLPKLAEFLEMDEDVVLQRITDAQQYSWHRTSRLFTEVSFEVFSRIQENSWQLPGIGHQVDSKRNYPSDIRASHVLGYLREASREEYLRSEHIRLADKIGKSGLEQVYEDYLRGESGTNYIQVNAFGQSLGTYDAGNLNKTPTKGADLITTLDADLQILGERLMENKKGALVAMDPKTGGILAMVSAPQYDVSKLAGRMDFDYWQSINLNPNTPLYNRAISTRQPPGSVFKPFMGLVGLEMGLITPQTEIYNPGAYYRERAYRDLADPGNYDLEKAIAKSSNTYFFWMMDQIASNGHLNTWSSLIKEFGMGTRNNIDLPSETTGIIPDSTYMQRTFGDRYWGVGDLMSLGVGQGMISVSPLQMAVAVSTLANRGTKMQPHIVGAIQYPDGQVDYTTPENRQIDWIKPEFFDAVEKGMIGSVTEGSGRFYGNVPGINVAGKTGTAQNPHGENHGWFVTYAPVEDPQIVVAVLMENSGFGSISATPVASLLVEQYLKGQIERQHVYDYVIDFQPRVRNNAGEEVEVEDEL